ncbi:hypothetical protein E2C01_101570 [Portunus trituberculatus]|uniref:Uncharacterized protein n=1 Tax=Portunus trituberculatus TaxID=210409 RepID=A0A5B7K602_PORTR|nr:hypothetical protein [Portunus trituberculatus]
MKLTLRGRWEAEGDIVLGEAKAGGRLTGEGEWEKGDYAGKRRIKEEEEKEEEEERWLFRDEEGMEKGRRRNKRGEMEAGTGGAGEAGVGGRG